MGKRRYWYRFKKGPSGGGKSKKRTLLKNPGQYEFKIVGSEMFYRRKK